MAPGWHKEVLAERSSKPDAQVLDLEGRNTAVTLFCRH